MASTHCNWTETRRIEIDAIRRREHWEGQDLRWPAMRDHELLAAPDCAARDLEISRRQARCQRQDPLATHRRIIDSIPGQIIDGIIKSIELKHAAYTLQPHWFPTFRRWLRWFTG